MKATDAIMQGFRKSFTISGRASRSEFWWFLAFHLLAPVVLFLLAGALGMALLAWVGIALFLATVPGVVCGVIRRSRDAGRSGLVLGALALAAEVAFIGALVAMIAAVADFALNQSVTGQVASDLDIGDRPEMAIWGAPLLLTTSIMDVVLGSLVAGAFAVALLSTLGLPLLVVVGFLVWRLTRPSQPGPNQYGPNPHEVSP